ncbi:hypothetical protein [Pinibacter soli]|uniref:Uncharacterized protein n=1 Tax=Pinibacter soli TaxID=3044211 RepID=A0ABT6RBC7_9BACT|nr:hypothetical protein [Pinibacter soli]MDI3319871.1 hypothetical protein [Pinibacter soli]
MGHFVISLPNNSYADVHFGTVRKKQFLSLRNILSGKWWHTEKQKGYVVIIDQQKKCILLKTMEEEWINETSDEQSIFLQTKIDEFESTHQH